MTQASTRVVAFAAGAALFIVMFGWTPAAFADQRCTGKGRHIHCVDTKDRVGPWSPGVLSGTEWVKAVECGPRRKDFSDLLKEGKIDCVNALGSFCPLTPPAVQDPAHEVVVYVVYRTGTTSPVLRTEVDCNVAVGPRMPTMQAIRDEVTKRAPDPKVHSGGTNYLINAAIVFAARSTVTNLHDVSIPPFDLAGHRIAARLHLTKSVWSWGDGATDTFSERAGDALVGQPYDDATPCESATVCSRYISHVYMRTGPATVKVRLYWDATATIDNGTTQVPIPNGVHNDDPVGRTVMLRQASAVLVPSK